MTDCPNAEIRDLLPGYAHDRLSAAERAIVEAHLATCDECGAELALIRAAARALGRLPEVDVERIAGAMRAPGAGLRVVHGRTLPSASARRMSGWRQAAAVAAVAVGAISLTIAGSAKYGGKTGGPRASERDAVVTDVGGGRPTAPMESAPAPVNSNAAPPVVAARASAARELTMAGGVADLSDAALLALLGDIDSFDEAVSTEPADLLPALTEEEEIDIR